MKTMDLREVNVSSYKITKKVIWNCICNLFVCLAISLMTGASTIQILFGLLFIIAMVTPAIYGAVQLDGENKVTPIVVPALYRSTYRNKYRKFQLWFAIIATIMLSLYLVVFKVFVNHVNFVGGVFISVFMFAVIVIGSSLIFAVNSKES